MHDGSGRSMGASGRAGACASRADGFKSPAASARRGGECTLLKMADELEKFLEEQRAKLAQDKLKLGQDPPYMEMRTKSSDPVGATNQAVDSTANGNSLPIIQPTKQYPHTDRSKEENYGLSLPLGLEYDQKKQKLKEELRQDYRRYMAEKNSRIERELQSTVENLSLPISDRKSAKDRLRMERNQEYNELLREQDKYEQLRRDGRWIPKENIDPSDESGFQAARHLRSGQQSHESVSYKNDARTMEAYEKLLNKKRQEEDRYRSSDDPEVGHRRNVQTQTERSGDYENNFPDSSKYFQRLKNEYRQYKERYDQELPLYIQDEYKKEYGRRPVSATEKSRYLINEVHDSPRERSKSALVKDDAIFGTGLLLGNNERESAQRRRMERYRQELLEQISERQKSKKREKELELNVAASGAVDPEKEPDRIRQFGAITHQHNSRRRAAADQKGKVLIGKYSSDDRSAEEQPPERPRVAFQAPAADERNHSIGLPDGMWNPLRNLMAPRVTTVPPPPPPALTEHYHTPYDSAYYFYGARNPLDPNLAYYGPGVIGTHPVSLINPQNGLSNVPMQGYLHNSSVDQSYVPNVRDASTSKNLDGGFLPEQQAFLSKESTQTYQDFLKKQMQEREERKRKEKEETERYDAKLEQEMKIYNPWGRGGGGAPLRDAEGNLLTDLKKMHKQNENAYRDFPHQGNQDSKNTVPLNLNLTRPGADTPQQKAQGFTVANAPQIYQGNPMIEQHTERKVPDQEKYKEYLRLQIEEKRRKAEEEREKCKLEEQREEKRLAEQRARIAKELEEEQEKKRRKEEEQRLKNEEIVRLAEERRKLAEKKRKEEEEKQELLFRQQAERERSARADEKRPPSPPIPTVKNKQFTFPRADLSPANVSIHELDLDRPHSGTKSPPVPARRNQLRAHEEKRDIISELSALRRQLRSEERRLEDQFQNADIEDDGAVANVRKRERNQVDVFDLARQRIQALVHRPSSKGMESVNLQNIREFNDLKYRDSATRAQVRQMYPDPPNDSNTLEIQQEALLREQKKKLDGMKRKAASNMNSHHIDLQTRDSQEDLTKNSLLESESAFLGSHGETFHYPVDAETTTGKLPPRERRRRNQSRQNLESEGRPAVQPISQPDSISLHSVSSFNLDQVRARNEQRMKRLQDLQHSGNDITVEDDDILGQFISKDKGRPISVETEATEVWLRPGTSETLKRFMSDHTQLDRGPSANTSAFNWRSQRHFTIND
ncbi:centrosome and spindle pole-associated protein 1 isoform X3 [Hypanus sabinus]|uniref:centrosome and spindle pole-associated protein 1 isoform X3 n=1 Tax=Hypanus sabinus TaxID=79690 RepID=UPI0028C48C6B|nr:centrosome and spindle pole-associated protein 1 isoform X3 [Hypanus sabinus]